MVKTPLLSSSLPIGYLGWGEVRLRLWVSPSQGTNFDLIGVGKKGLVWLYLILFKIFAFIIILVKSLCYHRNLGEVNPQISL